MNLPVVRLGTLHKRLAYTAFVVLWASGALWLLFHYFMQTEGDFGPEKHPLEAWWLRLHGLAVMLALFTVGSLATNHMRLAWQRRKNLGTGIGMLGLTLWLAGTGYALYYFSGDEASLLPVLHWAVGLAMPVAITSHILLGRLRPARAHAHHAPAKPAAHTYVSKTQRSALRRSS